MISFFLLPTLTFVGADKNGKFSNVHDKFETHQGYEQHLIGGDRSRFGSVSSHRFHPKHGRSRQVAEGLELRVLNGSKLLMECTPAEYLVRTHMAPDFESPQLVRKLDWFHNEALIASFQQDAVTDISEEWWVASTRHELRRPFYQLRISPVLSSDSGEYKCVLETDPLFTLDHPFMTVELLVIVKPPPPSKPTISVLDGQDERKNGIVLVSWNHSIGVAHRPIIRYFILISRADDSANVRLLTTDNNRTSRIVDSLLSNVQYVFSIKAENAAGESDFSSESIFIVKATTPKDSPKILSIRNQTSEANGACVEVEWVFDWSLLNSNDIVGYKITVIELLSSSSSKEHFYQTSHKAKEWHVKRADTNANALLCSLEFGGEFQLKIEADTAKHGFSPPAVATFRTTENVPSTPPTAITARVSLNGSVALSWEEPIQPNGRIISYQIYVREKHHSSLPRLFRLLVKSEESANKTFTFNLTELAPDLLYEVQISASTSRGEGVKSAPVVVQTQKFAVFPPRITSINYECSTSDIGQNSILIEWTKFAKEIATSALKTNSTAHHVNDQQLQLYFYRVQFEESSRKFTLNATSNFVKIDNLEPGRRYTVIIIAIFYASTNKNFLYETMPSKSELFKIEKDGCTFHSSLCSQDNQNCRAIAANRMLLNRDTASIFLVLLGILSTTFLSIVFTVFLKRHSSVFTFLLYCKKNKKNDLKKLQKTNGMFRRESLSLINNSLLLDMSEATFGRTVTAVQFDDYFDELSANNNEGFRRQFQELNESLSTSTTPLPTLENGSLPTTTTFVVDSDGSGVTSDNIDDETQRISKNRYINVLATEHSRIRLNRAALTSRNEVANQTNSSSSVNDGYINANYVDSCDEKNVYIATQAPLPHTFADFWAMIWQENCSVIVMITNLVEAGKRKCDQYWPSSPLTPLRVGLTEGAADFEITLSAQNVNAIFTHRIFTLTHVTQGNKAGSIITTTGTSTFGRRRVAHSDICMQRVVHQLQFTSWPDHGVPSTVFPLLHFLNAVTDCHNSCQQINAKKSKNFSPIVVHCSAGVGRSGSFILIDSMRRHLLRCDRVNLEAHLRRMRRQRARLVQTLEQYIFCHDALRNLIRHGVSRQSVASFAGYMHFLLSESAMSPVDDGKQIRTESHMQRQFQYVCKCKHDSPCQRAQSSAISLPGYYRENEFIVANWSSECAEFWSAVWRNRCPLILLLGSHAEVGDFFRITDSATSTKNAGSASWQIDDAWIKSAKKLANGNCLTNSTALVRNENALIWPQSPNCGRAQVLNTSLIESEAENEKVIRLKTDNVSYDVKVLLIRPSALESDIWTEIERIQDFLLEYSNDLIGIDDGLENNVAHTESRCEQRMMMLLDPRSVNSAMPFILCALQSAACQMETEGFIDVLLYLAWYKHIFCGCWPSQLRICSAHFAGGEKKEGDIPVPDPQFDPPLFISLPPRGESLRYNNAEQRQQRLLTKRLKLLNNKNQYISNQPITINKRQNGRTLKGNSSVDANNSDISSANGGVHGNGSFASDGECSKFIDKFFESTYAALHRESPNDANAASTSAGLFGSTHQYQQQSALSLDLPSESNLAPFLNFLGMKSFGMHPGLNPQHAQQHSFSAGTSMQGTTSAPISSIVGSKPLVALLDGRDCTIEMPLLKDIATVAFCDAQTTAEIHEKVLNEAVAAILYHSISLSRDDLSKFKNLRTVVRIGSGFHNIDLNAATDFNIAVCNTPAESVDETAETTMIMILNMFRRTFWQAKITQTAQRNTFSVEQLRDMAKSCPRIRGSVLGIVGLGRIGMAVAMRARVFGFRVIFYDPYIPNGIERSLEIERCDTLDDLFRQSDCISLHCPLNGETRFMINADSVNKMKNGVAIVNTSAADLIIISVLLSGLKNGNIRAAALDIYERESSSFGDANNATFEMLCKMPNLLYTPHYAWYSDESSKELRMAAAREVRRALIGRSPDDLLNCVNREALIIKKTTSTALSLLATGNLPGIQQLAATNQFPFNRSSVAGAQTGSFFQSPTKMATMSRLSVPGARISHQALDASSLLGLLQQPGPGNSGAAQQQLQNLLAQLAAAGGQQTPTDLNSLAISLNATTNNLMYQDLLTTLSQQILNSQQQQQQIVNADTAGYSLAVSQGGSVPHESIPHSAYELGGGATTSLMGISTGGGGGSGRSSTSQQGGSAYDLPASSSSYRVAGTKRKDRSPLQSGVLQKMGVPESRVMSDSIPSEMRNEPMDATHINVEESGPQSMVDRHPVHQSPSSSKNGAINDRMNVDPDGLHSDTTRVDEGNNPEDPATEPIKEPCELN